MGAGHAQYRIDLRSFISNRCAFRIVLIVGGHFSRRFHHCLEVTPSACRLVGRREHVRPASAPHGDWTRRFRATHHPTALPTVGEGEPGFGGETEGFDVDSFVVAMESGGEFTGAQRRAEQAKAVGDGAGTTEE